MHHTLSPTRRQSDGSIFIDSTITSGMYQDVKAKSQTSLLTALKEVPKDSNRQITVPTADRRPVSDKSKYFPKAPTNQGITATSGFTGASISPAGHHYNKHFETKSESSASKFYEYPKLIKSASSSGLFESQTFEDPSHASDNMSLDKVDGLGDSMAPACVDGKDIAVKWNPTVVDIKMTEIMLQSLDDHIKEKQDKIDKYASHKEEMVDKLITNFNLTSDDKLSKKNRREYETQNRSAEKSLEKAQMELEQLQYKRLIVSQEGIPWGAKPADHVKNISKKKSKKTIDLTIKECPEPASNFTKGYPLMSASAENISEWSNTKSKDHSIFKPWFSKSGSEKRNKGSEIKGTILEYPSKGSNNGIVILPKSSHPALNLNKPSSIGNSSAVSCDAQGGDKGNTTQGSKSNSVSSHVGKDHTVDTFENPESSRNPSLSVTSAEDPVRGDDVLRQLSLHDDMNTMKKEIQEVRSECHRFQCMAGRLRLDMDTDSELNAHKIQNAIERIDKLERTQEVLRQEYQIEFYSWKNDFRSLEEKLDYRLTTTRRDLQDNIDACNNSISLVEKRTEQMPFMSNRSGRSDMKIITDHLCNLVVSLIAFIMLLISSGVHLLIKFLNIGATISQNRNTILLPLIIAVALGAATMKWSLFSRLLTALSNSDNTGL